MKFFITQNMYKSNNVELYISDSLKDIEAFSYSWWKFISVDSVGNIIFNNSTYSISTSRHQREAKNILDKLGIKVDLYLHNTQVNLRGLNGINDVINSEIKSYKELIKENIKGIRKKGSHKKTNVNRKKAIAHCLFKIKDLRNIRNNYINKKRIPKNKIKIIDINKNALEYQKYFKKQNGKLKLNEFKNFVNRFCNIRYIKCPENIDKIKDLFNIKNNYDLSDIVGYQFCQDLNNMIPDVDSNDYLLLKKYMKKYNINLPTCYNLDKLHEYFINKTNRQNYQPKEPMNLNLNERLLKLQHLKDIKLIKTVKELRKEGREQHHCIGSKEYIKNAIYNNFQALRYKNFTFWLDKNCNIIQTSGKYNKSTPIDLINELNNLINRRK